MEMKAGIVLKHIPTGQYYSKMADHTKHLWSAWRFIDIEQLNLWLQASRYAPERPDEYEPAEIEMTIQIKELSANVQEK